MSKTKKYTKLFDDMYEGSSTEITVPKVEEKKTWIQRIGVWWNRRHASLRSLCRKA